MISAATIRQVAQEPLDQRHVRVRHTRCIIHALRLCLSKSAKARSDSREKMPAGLDFRASLKLWDCGSNLPLARKQGLVTPLANPSVILDVLKCYFQYIFFTYKKHRVTVESRSFVMRSDRRNSELPQKDFGRRPKRVAHNQQSSFHSNCRQLLTLVRPKSDVQGRIQRATRGVAPFELSRLTWPSTRKWTFA
jgi:hypothetical protein